MRRVAVTGMGIISPVGNDLPTYWDSLVQGKCGIGPLTYFDTTDYKAKLAAQVKDFDALAYMDKGEQRKYDPFIQFALGAAQQAMEDSGVAGTVDPCRLGVYFGSGIGGMQDVSQQLEILMTKGPRRVSPFAIPMMISNMAAGVVAIRHQAKGPCLPVVTACATSTHAIGEAFRAIRHGYADAIIAGGSEAAITPIGVAGFINCMALHTGDDPNAASLPFDKRRSGFVMGEGAGALVLEEYDHAVARGARIYAEVVGYGSTCDAHHMTAPAPDGEGAARAIRDSLEELGGAAGVDAGRVYYNAHGTGTPLNDATETMALKTVFGEEQAHRLLISSTKSCTGHMLGATGAAEAIAAIQALVTGVVPPTINLNEPDPECDLDYVPNVARKAQLDLALSASLGFGGHNACLAMRKV